jgi:two-component system response regulator DesR
LDGASITDVAAQLYFFEGKALNHISTAIQKLNVHNRMEAAHLAKERGWL